ADIPPATARELQEQLVHVASLALKELADQPIEEARLPLSEAHAQLFELAAKAERNGTEGTIHAWPTNPWKPLYPLEREETPVVALSSALMRGERRSLALNIRSTSPAPQIVQLELSLPGFSSDALRIYRVNWTGNDMS